FLMFLVYAYVISLFFFFFFFFSSRRRHTRSKRDWSSDVCSSDLVELCLSPKSNSAYKSLDKAMTQVTKGKTYDIPDHLKDTHYSGAKSLGHGEGYKYPHHYKNG